MHTSALKLLFSMAHKSMCVIALGGAAQNYGAC